MSKEVFNEGPTTSQHVESNDAGHFQNSSFKLKRTRSMGLLDNFITPSSTLESTIQTNSGSRNPVDPSSKKKLTSGSYIPQEALSKLKLKATTPASLPTPASKFINEQANYTKPGNFSNSPQSFQSDENDFSDDFYNSEDSLSSLGSTHANSNICLIPKHQLKKMGSSSSSSLSPYNSPNIASKEFYNPNISPDHQTDISNLLHDDTDVKDAPKEHVDYLTHKWDENEISKSWKFVVLRRNDVADSARLENASWRTWAQTRLNLKTISPEELNWSKDTDVTWLYGPVIKSESPAINNENLSNSDAISGVGMTNSGFQFENNKNSNIDAKRSANGFDKSSDAINKSEMTSYNADNSSGLAKNTNNFVNTTKMFLNAPSDNNSQSYYSNDLEDDNSCEHLKSILKKKSNVEKMISDASYSRLQHLLESREKKGTNDFTHFSSKFDLSSPAPSANSSNSILSNDTITDVNAQVSRDKTHSQRSSNSTLKPSHHIKSSLKNSSLHIQQHNSAAIALPSNSKKHIHFNMRVDQCIAVDSSAYSDNETNTENQRRRLHHDDTDDYPVSKMVSSTYSEDNDNHHFGDSDEDSDYSIENDYSDSDDDDDDDDDEGFVLNTTNNMHSISHRPKRNAKRFSRSKTSRPQLHAATEHEGITTIAPLPATTLKFGSDDEYENNNRINKMDTLSHNTKTNRGYDYYYDYNTVYSNNANPFIYQQPPVTPDPSYTSVNSSMSNSPLLVNNDVEMYDVPTDFQVMNDAEIFNHSPIVNTNYSTFSNSSSLNASPLLLPQTLINANGGTVYGVNAPAVVDIPTSCMHDVPEFHEDLPDQASNDVPTFDLKRTSSVGSRSNSMQSLTSSIKTGLSGLDLSNTGLKRSTGTGSKPQLFQLAQGSISAPVSNESNISRSFSGVSNSSFKSKPASGSKFSLDGNNSDDGSSSGMDQDDDDEDEDVEELIKSQTNLMNAVKSATSVTSLSDINRQYSGLNVRNSGFNFNSDDSEESDPDDNMIIKRPVRKINS